MKLDKRDCTFNRMASSLIKYIETLGGTALVVGGIKIGQEIGALKFNYFIQIGITGKMPTKKNL